MSSDTLQSNISCSHQNSPLPMKQKHSQMEFNRMKSYCHTPLQFDTSTRRANPYFTQEMVSLPLIEMVASKSALLHQGLQVIFRKDRSCHRHFQKKICLYTMNTIQKMEMHGQFVTLCRCTLTYANYTDHLIRFHCGGKTYSRLVAGWRLKHIQLHMGSPSASAKPPRSW